MLDLRSIAALGSRDDVVGALADRELAPLLRFFLRARMGAIPLLLLLAGLLWAYDPKPWKLAVVGVGTVVLIALAVRDRELLHSARLAPGRAITLLGSVMTAHGVLITLTGGIHSPLLVVFPLVTLLAAVVVGRVRLVGILGATAIAVCWVLAADDVVGPVPRLVPPNFAEVLPQIGGPAFAVAMAVIMTIALTASAVLGLLVRGAVERAIAGARDARAETLATLREQNRELWTLSGAIAHELKNPLASVQGLSGLLARRFEGGTKEAERMTVMREEVDRMGSIIDEFLNFSRPLTEMTRREVEPQPLVDKVLALLRPLAEGADVRLEGEVTDPGLVRCDPRKLTQVLINLLHNAIDASPPGGVVRLGVRRDPSGVRFEVLDEGPGLDPQIRERLFSPGATTKPAGSGIGLVVARAIAEQHGGTLTLTDRPQQGCRALLLLPSEPPTEVAP